MFRILKADWIAAANAHRRAVQRWTLPFRERRKRQVSHPVEDFLFIYYQYSSSKLENWHPGIEYLLEGATTRDFAGPGYCFTPRGAYLDPDRLDSKERSRLNWTAELLERTAERKGNYACLGLHEWAMVYRGQEVRHEKSAKLRLPQVEIDAIVESRPICCSHFDAFRFFADQAVSLNRLQPTMESRPEHEQPACIHANMDLYKWAFKSMPWVGSQLLLRCFHLAMLAREVDMRASPYDLQEFGEYEPILIETAAGRAEYEQEQRRIAEAAMPLRKELSAKIRRILEIGSKA